MDTRTLPGLEYYTDPADLIAVIRDRGVRDRHEANHVADMLEAWVTEADRLEQEVRELSTYRANAAAEELEDARQDARREKDRADALQIELHDTKNLLVSLQRKLAAGAGLQK